MGKASRRKGLAFERRIAIRLRSLWADAKRGFQTRGGTAEAPDVDGTPYYIECKFGARPNIGAAMRQASEGSDGRPPVAITHQLNQPTYVTMLLEDWIECQERSYSSSQTTTHTPTTTTSEQDGLEISSQERDRISSFASEILQIFHR